jgi:hypothetical protein
MFKEQGKEAEKSEFVFDVILAINNINAYYNFNFNLRTVVWLCRQKENLLHLLRFKFMLLGIYEVWWSEFLATDPEARVRFPALPEKKSSGSGTGFTKPREYN